MPFQPDDRKSDEMSPISREREDDLDWLDNQRRSTEDCKKIDQRFLSGWVAVSSLWLIALMIGFGSIGGLAVVSYCFAHHFAGH